MKKYIKPTLEFVELRAEERLAACKFLGLNQKKGCPRNRLS